jgi:hypothetical protein
LTILDRLRDASSYRLQIHISRTSQTRFVSDKLRGTLSALPKLSGSLIFNTSLLSDPLAE